MHYAFDVSFGAVARRPFGEFGKRPGFRHERVLQFATDGLGDTSKSRQCDAIVRFGFFELLNGLSARVNASADFFKCEA